MSRVWHIKGSTVNDDVGDLYYHGHKIKKAIYHGETVWEKKKKPAGIFQFVGAHGVIDLSVVGTGLSYQIDDRAPVSIITNPTDWKSVSITTWDESTVTISGNLTNLHFHPSRLDQGGGLKAVLTPYPSTMSAVTSLGNAFWRCYYLESIPAGLFDNCKEVTNFVQCFRNCEHLKKHTGRAV